MDKEIKKLRNDIGKFLHSYYVSFGEEKYEEFLKKISPSMVKNYGKAFSLNNLRIMEAEYVTLGKKIYEPIIKENTDK